ncbi:hypothetical protein [Deinococcus hohokamensis]|uniref:Uncharacterized protein n=1 Tax=Deinococcus hohokamensis TaxID=309883 RepID=A0ABV9ICV5_9DEIO
MTKRMNELVHQLCGGPDHPLAPVLREWCTGSRAFVAFAEAHESKLRKKVRLARQEEDLADLRAELAVAARLLEDPRLSLQYEPFHEAGTRGPDFALRFRTHPACHVEVTRLRPGASGSLDDTSRLSRLLCGKVGQCPPGLAAVLVVWVPPGLAQEGQVAAAVQRLDQAAQAEPPPPGLRPEEVQAFRRHRSRLSAVALLSWSPDQPVGNQLWLSPQARHPLAPELARTLASLLLPNHGPH